MKALSYILTCLLVLPILYVLFYTWQYIHFNSLLPGMRTDKRMLYEMLSPIIIEVLFIIVAIVLNIKRKFRENSIMCGTLLVSFTLSILLHFSLFFLYTLSNK
jgi:hypothetical protein